MWIVYLADNSHEMSSFIFYGKKKKNRMSSATNFAWLFKSKMTPQMSVLDKQLALLYLSPSETKQTLKGKTLNV